MIVSARFADSCLLCTNISTPLLIGGCGVPALEIPHLTWPGAQGGWRGGLSSCNDVLAALPAVADAGHGSVEVARALAKVADEVCRIESDEVDGSLVTMARKRFAPAGVSETSCVP